MNSVTFVSVTSDASAHWSTRHLQNTRSPTSDTRDTMDTNSFDQMLAGGGGRHAVAENIPDTLVARLRDAHHRLMVFQLRGHPHFIPRIAEGTR